MIDVIMAKETIYDKKENRLNLVGNYLRDPQEQDNYQDQSTSIRDVLSNHKVDSIQDISTILRYLDQLQDANSGIIWYDQNPGFLIRDARNAIIPNEVGTESFEKQYLNAARAAIDLIEDIDASDIPIPKNGEPPLHTMNRVKQSIFKKVKTFTSSFHKIANKSQKELQKLTFGYISELATILREVGILDPIHKLNIAKNYQNFNDTHNDFATIKNIEFNGKTHTVIESEVGLRELTDQQKKEYKNMESSKWFTALEPFEQDLVRKYKPQITGGSYTIPTELRRIPGIRNAFLKTTAIYEENQVVPLADSLHAGNVVSSSKDKNSRQDITDHNLEQIRKHFPDNTILNVNTLTTALKADEKIINDQLNNRTDKTNVTFTNTPFNGFRILKSLNTHQPIIDRVHEVAKILEENSVIKNYLTEPTGFIDRWIFKARTFFSRTSTSFEKAKDAIENLSENIKLIVLTAVELKQNLNNADNFFYRFFNRRKLNLNLLITENINKLDNKITAIDIPSQLNPKEVDHSAPKNALPGINIKHVINLITCKSGIDRTGYAEHYISAKAITDHMKYDVKEVIEQLSHGNHTASITGTSFAGGASLGADGIKPSTAASMPEELVGASKHLMRDSAGGNKFTEGKLRKGAKALENYEKEKKSAQNKNTISIANPMDQELSSTIWTDKLASESKVQTTMQERL